MEIEKILIRILFIIIPFVNNVQNIYSSISSTLSYDSTTSFNNLNITPGNVDMTTTTSPLSTTNSDETLNCPDDVECHLLGGNCISCQFNKYCHYGSTQSATCTPKLGVTCIDDQGSPLANFSRDYSCRYCYQLDPSNYTCSKKNATCPIRTAPRQYYISECKVKDEILCLGNREFKKKFLCNWTSGYKWSTALALSVTLGGFGVDRFYLGLWRQGLGKLFSFGGLGVWTLVDVILIATSYVGPSDGSLYI